MKLALKTGNLLLFLLTTFSCNQSDDNTITLVPLDSGVELEPSYDLSPQVAKTDELALSAFISTRALEDGTTGIPKIYLYRQSELAQFTAGLSEFATATRELAFALSPNGQLMAIFSRTPQEDGSSLTSLSIVTVETGDTVNQVSGIDAKAWIDDLAFAPDSGALVFTQWVDGSVVSHYLPVDSSGAPGTGIEIAERHSIEITSQSGVDYVKLVQSGLYEDTISLYKENGTSLDLEANTLALEHSSLPAKLGPQGLFYFQTLDEAVTKARLGNYVDEESEDNSGRGSIFVEEALLVKNITNLSEDIADTLGFGPDDPYAPLRPIEPHALALLEDVSLVVGGDYYYCENAAFYSTTFTLVNHSSKAVLTFIISNDADGVPEKANLDPCGSADGSITAATLFEQSVRSIDLKRAANGDYLLAFESWDTGEPEIYQLEFSISDFSSSTTAADNFVPTSVIAVSNNS